MADEQQQVAPEASRGVSLKLVLGGLVALLALIFVIQNNDQGDVHFLGWTASMPAWIWLLVIFAAGVLVGSVFPWLRPRRKKEKE